MYLVEASAWTGAGVVPAVVPAAPVEGPAWLVRFPSDFLKTVFTRVRTLLSLFSLSFGTAGPP